MYNSNRSVNQHDFAMIPRADIPRARFDRESSHKTTFNSGDLVPIYVDEVLPGDSFNMKATVFGRLATPIFPIMDNVYLDTFWFFVPNRLVWTNWPKFNGQQDNPGDSTSYVIPQQVSPANGYAVGSLQDYMGLPTVGTLTATKTVSHSALFTRAYNLIWNEWFRDENLQTSAVVDKGDGPDATPSVNYILRKRGKRHDYFTGCLPWPQKGSSVSLPLGTSAPIKYDGALSSSAAYAGVLATQAAGALRPLYAPSSPANIRVSTSADAATSPLYADLSQATAATINQLRQSFQIQRLLERDARGGTRYTEIVRAHFGVVSPDARLQRPEYLGGSSAPIVFSSVPQTSATGVSGSTTPVGTLSAYGTVKDTRSGFQQSFTEHGIIIGLASVRADLNYQQGLRKMWTRQTRFDFYWPAFAMLGEQAVLNQELYVTGDASDIGVFGYQERWAEYRYMPSMITGLFKSQSAGTIDNWHLAQRFTTLPTLNSTFIQESPPLDRVLAVGAGANGQQILADILFHNRVVRPMPLYSVPGLIDHF